MKIGYLKNNLRKKRRQIIKALVVSYSLTPTTTTTHLADSCSINSHCPFRWRHWAAHCKTLQMEYTAAGSRARSPAILSPMDRCNRWVSIFSCSNKWTSNHLADVHLNRCLPPACVVPMGQPKCLHSKQSEKWKEFSIFVSKSVEWANHFKMSQNEPIWAELS